MAKLKQQQEATLSSCIDETYMQHHYNRAGISELAKAGGCGKLEAWRKCDVSLIIIMYKS